MFKSFIEFLNESPVAAEGDYYYGQKLLEPFPKFLIDEKYKIFDKVKFNAVEYTIITSKVNSVYPTFYAGHYHGNLFRVDFAIKFKLNVKQFPGYKKIIGVDTVAVQEHLQGRGTATFFYNYFIRKLNVSIMSDETQFFGARRLWSKLSKDFDDVKVDVVNIVTQEVLKRNEEIYHGKLDDDFDTRYWARSGADENQLRGNYNKSNIRFILRKVL